MPYSGQIRNGVVVFEGPAPLAEGTRVRVEPEAPPPIAGTPGEELLRFRGLIDPVSLREMEAAIEDCGKVDSDGW